MHSIKNCETRNTFLCSPCYKNGNKLCFSGGCGSFNINLRQMSSQPNQSLDLSSGQKKRDLKLVKKWLRYGLRKTRPFLLFSSVVCSQLRANPFCSPFCRASGGVMLTTCRQVTYFPAHCSKIAPKWGHVIDKKNF